MNFLPLVRKQVIESLWSDFVAHSANTRKLLTSLAAIGEPWVLDHLGLRDLPGPETGIRVLTEAFTAIGFVEIGEDYVPGKQSRFVWMREENFESLTPLQTLPQVVVAESDFSRFSPESLAILEPLIARMERRCAVSLDSIKHLANAAAAGDRTAAQRLITAFGEFLSTLKYGVPTVSQYRALASANELTAWTIAFGRRVNHFGFGVYLSSRFENLAAFNTYIAQELGLKFNMGGGGIKGSSRVGIEQSATLSEIIPVELSDGVVETRAPFLEYVWRHELATSQGEMIWRDLYRDFLAENAETALESLYVGKP